MSWDDDKFERFVQATVRMARGEMPGYGYPHVVYPYASEDEMACIEAVRQMPGRLSPAGLGSRLLPVAPLVARSTARFSRRELRDASEYRRLETDLADPRNGITAKAAKLGADTIRSEAAEDTIILLCRLGALYPFGHVSGLLDSIVAAGIRNTLAVAYPGTAEGTQLRFLGMLSPTGGYRGHVVT